MSLALQAGPGSRLHDKEGKPGWTAALCFLLSPGVCPTALADREAERTCFFGSLTGRELFGL